jgi:membrane protein implicated in regulation of membrane protease activity
MLSFIISLGPWNWIILGAILLALEVLAPGAFMMWFGLSALVVGVISFVWSGLSWEWQGVAFAVIAVAMIPLWRRLANKPEFEPQEPSLNRRAEALVGRSFTLDKPIVDGFGTVRVDDTVWRITGAECPAGTRVKVVRADGVHLMVEPA